MEKVEFIEEATGNLIDALMDTMKCIPVSLVKRLAKAQGVNEGTLSNILSRRLGKWGWRWAIRGVYCNCEKSYKPTSMVRLTLVEAAKLAVAELVACGGAATLDELVERAAEIYEMYGGRVDEETRRRLRATIRRLVHRVQRIGYDEHGRLSAEAIILN